LLAEKELVNDHHLDHLYTQNKPEGRWLKALKLLESRTKCLDNEKENSKANKKQ